MPKDKAKPLPCPFCACEVKAKTKEGFHALYAKHDETCPFNGEKETVFCYGDWRAREKMIFSWNIRKYNQI